MTNQEKYTTVKERHEAFKKFCDARRCEDCKYIDVPNRHIPSDCAFLWLADEFELTTKLKKCPHCGGEAEIITMPFGVHISFSAFVKCKKCGARTAGIDAPSITDEKEYNVAKDMAIARAVELWNARTGDGNA